MRTVTDDEGAIIHWAGAQHRYPVRGQDGSIGFGKVGESDAGRRRIGWGEFMAVRRREDRVLVYDDDRWALPRRREADSALAQTSTAAPAS